MTVGALFLAEFIGTMVLIFLGNSVVANVLLKDSKGNGSGWIVITTGWAFAVAIAAYITGGISGAHLNPALTISFMVIGMITPGNAVVYIIAQMLGAMAGAGLVYLMYKQHYDATEDPGLILATFSTGPAIRNKFWNTVSETLATAMLVFGILGITAARNNLGPIGTYLVGVLIWSLGLSLGGPTGYAINHARDIGPRIMHQFLPIKNKGTSDWDYAVVPIVGPVIGAIAGALLYTACTGIWG